MSCIAIDLHSDCFTTATRADIDGKSVKLVQQLCREAGQRLQDISPFP